MGKNTDYSTTSYQVLMADERQQPYKQVVVWITEQAPPTCTLRDITEYWT